MIELDTTIIRRHLAFRWGVGAARVRSVEEITSRLLSFDATNPVDLSLSILARGQFERVSDATNAIAESIEHNRDIVRIFAMHRSMHLVHRMDLSSFITFYNERFGSSKMRFAMDVLVSAGRCDRDGARALYETLCARIIEVIGDEARTVNEIAAEIPEIQGQVQFASGQPYETAITIASCLIEALAVSGELICARSRSDWRTTACGWANRQLWLAGNPSLPGVSHARSWLVARYLSTYGPATSEDICWWTGLGAQEIAEALRPTRVTEVRVTGWSGVRWMLESDLALLSPQAAMGAALLPALDPVLMAYRDRTPWIPADHTAELCDRDGSVGPTVWSDGRVVGGWGLSRAGAIVVKLFENLDNAQTTAIADETARLERALAGQRIFPRLVTPLVRELWG